MSEAPTAAAATTVGIVAGEASGDALAATLIAAARARMPQLRFAGVAGPKMVAAGCEQWVSTEKLAVRGVTEVVRHLPSLIAIRRELASRFIAERVPVFVGVDAPDFNLGLERRLRARGVRTIHFVSPSVWAWRRGRIATIGRAADRVLALFPFEPPLYEAAGVPVTYVGHPMAAHAASDWSRRTMRERLRLGFATPVFALLPGSRLSEIEMHASVVIDAARRIAKARPDARFLVPLVSRATREAFEQAIWREGAGEVPMTLLYGHANDALRAADVGIVASGTATLEAALARCPHVIFYKVSAVTARLVRPRLLVPWVGLPNVLAGRFVVPELVQEEATGENLAIAALNLFDDTVARHAIERVFASFARELSADTGALAADALMGELARSGARA
ncbi:MAG TPA: lipid-A-disaccharide synthase [Casimicrobiaceae bacterium]|nr:lipid-A-disaccharide synthase [Casimicrobiaceae bacterium]